MSDHIHTWGDGRGPRDVYLDGVQIKRVMSADPTHGIVRVYHHPIRVCPRRETARTYKRRGRVEVIPRD